MNHLLFRFAAISVLLFGLNAGAHAEILPNSVHLQVYGMHQANDIVYQFGSDKSGRVCSEIQRPLI